MTFEEYLRNRLNLESKNIPYYLHWISCFQEYRNRGNDSLMGFQKSLMNRYEGWQIDQALKAVRQYNYFCSRCKGTVPSSKTQTDEDWSTAAFQMKELLRLRGRSYQREKSYLRWLNGFKGFLGGKAPGDLASDDLKTYLSWLAVERSVSPATQSQAFNALLFFYRNILEREVRDLEQTIRSKLPRRLPVVLTKAEIRELFSHLEGDALLFFQLLYGGGLRLSEGLNLRVKDLDFEKGCVTVISGKGAKDRITLLPGSLIMSLKTKLERNRKLYDEDRRGEMPGVAVSESLLRKYPGIDRQWNWFWLFPSTSLSVNPYTGSSVRYHLHPSTMQRQLKTALRIARDY